MLIGEEAEIGPGFFHRLCIILCCPLDLVEMKPINVSLRLNKETPILATADSLSLGLRRKLGLERVCIVYGIDGNN